MTVQGSRRNNLHSKLLKSRHKKNLQLLKELAQKREMDIEKAHSKYANLQVKVKNALRRKNNILMDTKTVKNNYCNYLKILK